MEQLQAGQDIEGLRGRFRVDRPLGGGGFGLTFEGRDQAGRRVALKQLRFERMRDWKALELFEREGRVLSQLSHPCIPAYIDFFVHDGQRAFRPADAPTSSRPLSWILVQELVEGPSLQQIAEGHRRLDAAQIAVVLRMLLETLAYLHELSPPVIHRDINPKNVVLDPSGRPFLVDFGAIQDRLRFEDQRGSTSVGTLGYMPLEQLRGAARPSSDLYALAMTILAVASGRSPAEMPVDDATGKILVDQVAPGLPPHLRRVLDRMAEPIAGQRVGSAREALALLAAAPPKPLAPPRPRPGSAGRDPEGTLRLLAGVVLTVAVVGGGVVAWGAFAKVPPPPVARAISPRLPIVTATSVPVADATGTAAQPSVPLSAFQVTWSARLVSASGLALKPGSPCQIVAEGTAMRERFLRVEVAARCGGQTVYDSRVPLNGTSMHDWEVSESPRAGEVGSFVYQLRYSDVGARSGERAQATLDTLKKQAIFFRETVPVYRVVLDVDPASATRGGEPLLSVNTPPFSRVISRQGKVAEVSGKSPVPVGASCKLVLSPGQQNTYRCRALLSCNGVFLYGAKLDNGFAPCSVDDGVPQGFVDPQGEDPRDDPETRVDLVGGVAEVRESRGDGFGVKIKLTP